MRLKTQFAILTGAVTLLPIMFAAIFFGVQQSPRDPREPTRILIGSLAEMQRNGQALTLDAMNARADEAGIPLREIAILTPAGNVLFSTFPGIPVNSQIKLTDLVPKPRSAGEPRAELRLMPLDGKVPESNLVLLDVQPFWSRQDIRNRNIFFIGAFAFILFAVSGITSLFILRSISKAIKTLEKDTSIVATGNLDHAVEGSGNHEIFMLANSINMMRLNLKDMLLRRSKMLMGVSHDMKTPIALIQGYADALADGVADDAESRDKYIQIIRDKARQLEDLSSELIDFLKIGGDGSVAIEEVDPEALMRALGERFASDAKLLNRNFTWGFGDDCSPECGFPGSLVGMNRLLAERALENLVTNAFRYSKPEGNIVFQLRKSEGVYIFSVKDDGPGIPDEDAPFVFDAFYRGSGSRSDGGHGFGLTIVKAVADLHGWTVSVGKRKDGRQGTEATVRMR
jgi:signal transduction histidine kinase